MLPDTSQPTTTVKVAVVAPISRTKFLWCRHHEVRPLPPADLRGIDRKSAWRIRLLPQWIVEACRAACVFENPACRILRADKQGGRGPAPTHTEFVLLEWREPRRIMLSPDIGRASCRESVCQYV